jgi:nucleotide-binding universal stress UspA family protein
MTNQGAALLAYDGSPSSVTALAVVGRLLSVREALVCHVAKRDDDEAKQTALRGAERARAAGLDAEPIAEHEHRKTWRTLLDAANRSGASVIVAGARGLSGIGPSILGSVSTALVHHSPIPVLVVPETAPEEAMAASPLLCYDGSDGAKHAISEAGQLLGARSALVLHCWESWVAEVPALAGISGTVQGMATELDEVATEQSKDRTAEGIDLAERAGFHAEGLSERAGGPIWKAALDAADQHASGVIVVGSRGLTGISAALGSVSNGIVHHSGRPVLLVPPEKER